MAQNLYRVIYEGGSGEIEEKKSRFIATIAKAESEEEAVAFIARMKKQYWDARHNCSAFVIGSNAQITRSSDDGEPSGTAGRPMLDLLLREGVYNVVVVVTRYFGGTLLGTGGLVRAYQGAVAEGLTNCRLLEKKKGYRVSVSTDYNGLGKIQYLARTQDLPLVDTIYGEKVEIILAVTEEELAPVVKKITEATNATAGIEHSDLLEFGLLDGNVIF